MPKRRPGNVKCRRPRDTQQPPSEHEQASQSHLYHSNDPNLTSQRVAPSEIITKRLTTLRLVLARASSYWANFGSFLRESVICKSAYSREPTNRSGLEQGISATGHDPRGDGSTGASHYDLRDEREELSALLGDRGQTRMLSRMQ